MAAYRAIENFKDLLDHEYKYRAGDSFPRSGYTPSAERIKELLSDSNKRGRAVIEEVKDDFMNKPVEAEADEQPAEVEAPKPKRRGRKKNAE